MAKYTGAGHLALTLQAIPWSRKLLAAARSLLHLTALGIAANTVQFVPPDADAIYQCLQFVYVRLSLAVLFNKTAGCAARFTFSGCSVKRMVLDADGNTFFFSVTQCLQAQRYSMTTN